MYFISWEEGRTLNKIIKKKYNADLFSSLLSKKQGLDAIFNDARLSANNFSDLLTALEKHESRHSCHIKLLCDVRDRFDVNLVELDIGVVLAPLFELGRNGLTRRTPLGIAVEDRSIL
jgi:hypothetical protein